MVQLISGEKDRKHASIIHAEDGRFEQLL